MQYTIINNRVGRAWYAMKASYGRALKAKLVLDSLGIESYVPMSSKRTKLNGRNHITSVAAIPSLIFVNVDREGLEIAKSKVDYLHNMLTRCDEQASVLETIVVSDREMSRFIRVVTEAQDKVRFIDAAINQKSIERGVRVRVIGGEYEGCEGVLCRPKGSRAKRVLVDLCGVALIELPVIDIELIESI